MGRHLAVAQHGRPVAKAEHLVEAMRHVEDDLALRPQGVDQAEQHLALVGRQRGGGLVERDHFGFDHHGLGDLHHLALPDGEMRDPGARGDAPAHGRKGHLGPLVQRTERYHAARLGKRPSVRFRRP